MVVTFLKHLVSLLMVLLIPLIGTPARPPRRFPRPLGGLPAPPTSLTPTLTFSLKLIVLTFAPPTSLISNIALKLFFRLYFCLVRVFWFQVPWGPSSFRKFQGRREESPEKDGSLYGYSMLLFVESVNGVNR